MKRKNKKIFGYSIIVLLFSPIIISYSIIIFQNPIILFFIGTAFIGAAILLYALKLIND